MQMELMVQTDLEKSLPSSIDFNENELREKLEAALEKYKGVVVTEDSVKDAAKDRASLNNFKKALNDRRIAIGKEWGAPMAEFKTKVDALIAMVDEPVQEIDRQVKAFEQAEKDNKRASIKKFYLDNAHDLAPLDLFDKLFDDKWLNKGTVITDATNQLFDRIDKVRQDIKIIRAMKLENVSVVLDAYLRNFDMSAALAEKNRFEEQQAALAKAVAHQKEADAEKEERTAPPASFAVRSNPQSPVIENVKTIKVIFYNTTPAFRADMKALTEKHGIEYGGIS